jgi:hypothetical protein
MRFLPPPPQRHVFLWGVAAALLYLVALSQVRLPVRILYDGEAPPPPYRWVHPPPASARDNQPPEPGTGAIALSPAGSEPASIVTGDAQAGVIFPRDAIVPHRGISRVEVRITPLDPDTTAPAPPGLRFDGNAYHIDATYASGEPIALRKPITPVLRYPIHATVLLRSAAAGWTSLKAHRVEASLQIFGPSDRPGVFVAAAPFSPRYPPWVAYIAAAAGIIIATAGLLLTGRRVSCTRYNEPRGRTAGH